MNGSTNIWNQTFTLTDPFGNLKKDVPPGGTGISFLPIYNQSTNRISSLPGCTTSYDANGNILQDCARGVQDTYTWNADGKPNTLDDVTVVYDALGRGVERKATVNPTLYTPIVYTPGGQKLASLVVYPGNSTYYVYRAFVPLPGGATAVYGNYTSSILFYRHPDWLGSGRLETAPDRTIYQSVAYAPYGEDYSKSGAPNDLSFTGQTQDEISVTYDFMFRDYSAITGRWYSPDPAGLAAVDPSNPQTWNRYGYVGNQPLIRTDPLGLRDCLDLKGNVIPCPPPPPNQGDSDGPTTPSVFAYKNNDMVLGQAECANDAQWPCRRRKGANNTPCKGWSFGGTIGANAEIGGLPGGPLAAGTAGIAAGVFNNNFSAPGGTSLGATATGGGFVGGDMAVPNQNLTNPDAGGLYAGLGFGAFISNAGNPAAMSGHFATYTVDTPIGSVQFAKGGGIWSLSVTFGPGFVLGSSKMTTNTVARPLAGSGTCVGSSSGG